MPIASFRDLKVATGGAEGCDLACKVGNVEKLFSKRAMRYRQMGAPRARLSEEMGAADGERVEE